jgi:serine/threonine protein kinase
MPEQRPPSRDPVGNFATAFPTRHGSSVTGLNAAGSSPDALPPPPPTQVASLGLNHRRTSVSEDDLRKESAPPPAIPGYEILGELGHGSMGVVFKARQVRLDRVVCLKLIREGPQAEPEVSARFLIEAQALARMNHPNIVQIYEIGEVQGWPYFSMEFVEGESLAQKLLHTSLSARVTARLVQVLARAMHSVHQHGIVHRDLKPSNILLATAGCMPGDVLGTPKITDFGLAKRLDVIIGLTRSGAILGTPIYMAPEQANGRTRDVGPAADVYALGAILYELLTERPPFIAKTMFQILQQLRFTDPVPPSQLRPQVPCDLERICLKCLQKEPGKRYASAEALADDLRHFLEAGPGHPGFLGAPAREHPEPAPGASPGGGE